MTDQRLDSSAYVLDKRLIRRSFERAAAAYDDAAFLQQEIGDRLIERLDVVRIAPTRIVDVGAGTGYVAAAVSHCYPAARVVVADLAVTMVEAARRRLIEPPSSSVSTRLAALGSGLGSRLLGRPAKPEPGAPFDFVAADAEALPFADASADLIVSNLALQWCGDLDRVFAEFRRVLTPGGLLMFTTFGPDTLCELRAAWAEVDGYTHVNAFMDMHDIGDALMRAGLAAPVMDAETITVTYPEVTALMRDLKTIGANNVAAGRSRQLGGRERLQRLAAAYEPWRKDGVLPASYEVVYGHAWAAPQESRQKTATPEVRVSLGELRRRDG